jgi:hypothetical protein
VRLAGIDVRDADALGLAMLLRHYGHVQTADEIETACISYEREVALTLEDRDAIVAVLSDPPDDDLARLKGILLHQSEWRRAEGLS